MIARMPCRAPSVSLAVVLAAGVAWTTWERWVLALRLEAWTRGVDAETHAVELVHPGLPAAAALVRAAPGAVYTMPRADDPLAYQQLLALVYPLRPRPYEERELRSGDVVVLAAAGTLARAHDELFAGGPLRVVRVR
jgi:hypothetical protein